MGKKLKKMFLSKQSILRALLFTSLFVLSISKNQGQIIIEYISPNPVEVLQSDLYNLMIINSSSNSKLVNIMCKLNFGNTTIFQSELNNIKLEAGINQLAQIGYSESNVLYSNDPRFSFLKLNKTLSAGNYQWCVRLVDLATKEELNSNCFEIQVNPLTPPLLVYPNDKSEISILNPTFLWIGPGPQIKEDQFSYDIKISEIFSRQSPLDAIVRNFGHIMVNNLNELQLPYPFNSPTLENGKSYAWQVTAHNSLGKVLKTEIWSFKVKLDSAFQEQVVFIETALIPRRLLDGSFVNIQKEIKLDLSAWNTTEITYQILNVNGEAVIKNKKELISTLSGHRIILSLIDDSELKDKSLYTLEILDKKGNKGFISFKYFKK